MLFVYFQVYEKRLKQFRDSLLDRNPDLATVLAKKPRVASGAEVVQNDLDSLNRQYLEMLAQVTKYLHVLKHLHDREGLYFPVSV